MGLVTAFFQRFLARAGFPSLQARGRMSLGRAAVTVVTGRFTTWLSRSDSTALHST